MAILNNLNAGKKIHFEEDDIDVWGYNSASDILEQYINGTLTGNTLPVVSIDQNSITINWGDVESTLQEDQFLWAD
jgi:hypothetical protein